MKRVRVMTKLAVLVGSHRPQSQSAKVGRFIEAMICKEFPGTETFGFDLGGHPLPLWDEGLRTWEEKWEKTWRSISRELKSCDGFIVIAPAWHGMAPPALKNLLLLCEEKEQELAHKAGLIVAVSSSMGGAFPVAELRMSSYKNTHLCYIPEHITIRYVGDIFNQDEAVWGEEVYIRQRLKYALSLLIEYAKALKAVRESGVIDTKNYLWGM